MRTQHSNQSARSGQHTRGICHTAIRRQEPVAWDDLGAEAVMRLWLEEFPVVVINDAYGRDLYDEVIGPGAADE